MLFIFQLKIIGYFHLQLKSHSPLLLVVNYFLFSFITIPVTGSLLTFLDFFLKKTITLFVTTD